MLPHPYHPSEFKHVVLDDTGRPYVEGTRYQVRMLGLEHVLYGWSPEELKWQHSDLSMGQVCAALAYYFDHQSQMEAETEAERRTVDELRAGESQPSRIELERRRGV